MPEIVRTIIPGAVVFKKKKKVRAQPHHKAGRGRVILGGAGSYSASPNSEDLGEAGASAAIAARGASGDRDTVRLHSPIETAQIKRSHLSEADARAVADDVARLKKRASTATPYIADSGWAMLGVPPDQVAAQLADERPDTAVEGAGKELATESVPLPTPERAGVGDSSTKATMPPVPDPRMEVSPPDPEFESESSVDQGLDGINFKTGLAQTTDLEEEELELNATGYAFIAAVLSLVGLGVVGGVYWLVA